MPDGHHAVIDALDVEVVPGALLLGRRPADVRLEISCREVRYDQGRLSSLTLEADFLRSDTFAGVGRVALRVLDCPAEAGRARAPRDLPTLPEPVLAAVVGRLHEHDVVLGVVKRPAAGAGQTWQLRIDPSHPVLFDHPADHIPPMLLLEAARQAAQAVCAPYRVLPVEVRSAHHARAELDLPCFVTAMKLPLQDATEDAAVRVTAVQEGQLVFDSLVVAAFCD
ncbi:hypothetical protein NLX86_19625 [Streptomyces sp. A3M-1-3]|uniref:AfsA-related hotdog domain-containing protein n=1 Tax=Streptomyces sp. A3M-1-3 TaxID=2962044 RepID=UPI0020B72560|nr:AfsA-related hotdog domain-containing protein [Streptomyces sp. A3M-1-3]MCP3820228.1 hypothetical protein [Streptomyces sp. A3M-1-3]